MASLKDRMQWTGLPESCLTSVNLEDALLLPILENQLLRMKTTRSFQTSINSRMDLFI